MTEVEIAVEVSSPADLVAVREALRDAGRVAGLGIVNETKLVTAGSELVRNILDYATGGRGAVTIRAETGSDRHRVRATFRDDGPGIADLKAALGDGYSSGGGLGLGLPGAQRLVNGFSIETSPRGTQVEIVVWEW